MTTRLSDAQRREYEAVVAAGKQRWPAERTRLVRDRALLEKRLATAAAQLRNQQEAYERNAGRLLAPLLAGARQRMQETADFIAYVEALLVLRADAAGNEGGDDP